MTCSCLPSACRTRLSGLAPLSFIRFSQSYPCFVIIHEKLRAFNPQVSRHEALPARGLCRAQSRFPACRREQKIEPARIMVDAAKARLREKENDLADSQSETLKVTRGKSRLRIVFPISRQPARKKKSKRRSLGRLCAWTGTAISKLISASPSRLFNAAPSKAEQWQPNRRRVRIPHKKIRDNTFFNGLSRFGGPEETRTLDLTDANRALSHAGRFSLNSDYKNILKDAETGSISCFLTLSLRA